MGIIFINSEVIEASEKNKKWAWEQERLWRANMAKDDYYVIIYKILAYLYMKLKTGEEIEPEMLMYNGTLFQINRKYWVYIFRNMLNDGYITGLSNISVGDGYYLKEQFPDCQITPKGIEYLCENSLAEKAKQFLKDVKEITPFI